VPSVDSSSPEPPPPRLGGMEHEVAHTEVAVADRDLLAFGRWAGSHSISRSSQGLGGSDSSPLPRPARDLAREVVARLAEVPEPTAVGRPMQARHRLRHGLVHGRRSWGAAGQRMLAKTRPCTRSITKKACDDVAFGVKQQHAGHGNAGRGERRHHAVFAIDRVPRGAVRPLAACAGPASDRRSRRSTSDSTGRRRSV